MEFNEAIAKNTVTTYKWKCNAERNQDRGAFIVYIPLDQINVVALVHMAGLYKATLFQFSLMDSMLKT